MRPRRNEDIAKMQDDVGKLINDSSQLYKEGKYKAAEAGYRRALELDPDNTSATLGVEMARMKEQLTSWNENKRRNEEYQKTALSNGFANDAASSENPVVYTRDGKIIDRRESRKGSEVSLATSLKTPKEKEIEFKLRQPVRVSFRDTPFKDVVATLRAISKLNIVPDRSAMQEMGISDDAPLTLEVENIQLKSVLNMLLKQINMTYSIRDEVLQLTTEQYTRGKTQKRVYNVADLVVPIRDYPTATTDNIHHALQRHIQGGAGVMASGLATPITPRDGLPVGQRRGAPGGLGQAMSGNQQSDAVNAAALSDQLIKLIQNTISQNTWKDVGGKATIDFYPLGMALVVDQTEEAHDEIAGLLAQLRKMQEVQVAIEMRIISVSESFYEYVNMNFDLSFNSQNGNLTGSAGNNINGIGGLTFTQTPAGTTTSLASTVQNAAAAFAVPAFASLPGTLGPAWACTSSTTSRSICSWKRLAATSAPTSCRPRRSRSSTAPWRISRSSIRSSSPQAPTSCKPGPRYSSCRRTIRSLSVSTCRSCRSFRPTAGSFACTSPRP